MASLRWAGHVQRMEDEQMPKRLIYAKNQWEKERGKTKNKIGGWS
jgi:hypothetical protein